MRKLVESNTELRSKKALIEDFIARLNDLEDESEQAGIEHDIAASWQKFVKERREEAIKRLIEEEKLKEPETRKLLAAAFRDGELKTAGTEIDNIMPAMSFFKSPRAEKKQGIVEKLKTLLEEFFGIASPEGISGEEGKEV